MSTATVAPLAAEAEAETVRRVNNSEPICDASTVDLNARFYQRLAAEQALTDLEQAVQRLARRLLTHTTRARRVLPRRSRRSAWLPTE